MCFSLNDFSEFYSFFQKKSIQLKIFILQQKVQSWNFELCVFSFSFKFTPLMLIVYFWTLKDNWYFNMCMPIKNLTVCQRQPKKLSRRNLKHTFPLIQIIHKYIFMLNIKCWKSFKILLDYLYILKKNE